MNAVVYSSARNEKGPAKGLFPQNGDLHNIVVIVNYWNLFFGCGGANCAKRLGSPCQGKTLPSGERCHAQHDREGGG